jgi:hypothetical protein
MLADAGTGPCDSWCTNDVKYGKGCGDANGYLCNNVRCPNPDFRYVSATSLPTDGSYLCYKTAE